jgi:hypothetical protein
MASASLQTSRVRVRRRLGAKGVTGRALKRNMESQLVQAWRVSDKANLGTASNVTRAPAQAGSPPVQATQAVPACFWPMWSRLTLTQRQPVFSSHEHSGKRRTELGPPGILQRVVSPSPHSSSSVSQRVAHPRRTSSTPPVRFLASLASAGIYDVSLRYPVRNPG